jgi:hypothetical protein
MQFVEWPSSALALRLQRHITAPVLALADTATAVSKGGLFGAGQTIR